MCLSQLAVWVVVLILCTSLMPMDFAVMEIETRNTNYSSAYVSLYTTRDLSGHGVRPSCSSGELVLVRLITRRLLLSAAIMTLRHALLCQFMCAVYVGLHCNPTIPGPARRKENRKLVCTYEQDLGYLLLILNYDGRCC